MNYQVLTENPKTGILTYAHPDPDLIPGRFCTIPLGRAQSRGIIIGIAPEEKKPPTFVIKQLVPTNLQMPEDYIGYLRRVADYYHYPLGEVVRAGIPQGVEEETVSKRKKKAWESHAPKLKTLNPAQQKIFEEIAATQEPKTHLIFGVTGSGKTEIYTHLIQDVLKKYPQKSQALMLVPEISLTTQLHERIQEVLGEEVILWHSAQSPGRKREDFHKILSGQARVILGARSSILLPFPHLKIIVVDEEHDHSYKQEDRLRYHGRDLAVLRSYLQKIPCILGSATPSLESYKNTVEGRYLIHRLPKPAISTQSNTFSLIDLRNVKLTPGQMLTEPMRAAIQERLEKKEQILLYLGRRGFAHSLICEACGTTVECPACGIAITYYRQRDRISCHYCGRERKYPSSCESCSHDKFSMLGGGTEAIHDELIQVFPEARIERLDRDVITSHSRLQKVVSKVQNGEADILVGTQMVTKGFDFPNLTLVGVLAADLSLAAPDFRALERSFQLFAQVSGRAGRAEKQGHVILQTYSPDHPLFPKLFRNQYEEFLIDEIQSRSDLGYPPHGFLALLHFEHKSEQTARLTLVNILREIPIPKEITALGPTPCSIPKINDKYRFQVLLKSAARPALHTYLHGLQSVIATLPFHVVIDVDPMST